MVPNEGVNTDDRARVEVVNVPEPARSGVRPVAVLGVFPAILTLLPATVQEWEGGPSATMARNPYRRSQC